MSPFHSEDAGAASAAPRRESVAIIGLAGVFPGAPDLKTYWQNILNKVSSVGDPPPEWEAELFLDPTSESNDRVYCARGGYLGELSAFDPLEHGVMPNAVDGTEPDHFLALHVAKQALADAGVAERGFKRDRTEIVLGRGSYVNRGNTTAIQHGIVVDQVLRILRQLHPEHTEADLAGIRKALKDSLPPFHAETAPGLVPNIITGRIANRLDLMGANYIVDAACASSLVAVDLAMRDLLTGRCDLALAGGIHASVPPPIVMIFCHLKAISRRGEIRPFSRDADGTLLGEGAGMVVLKRTADALRDGDRIYAVLKAVGVASDGRAVGLLAPRLEGEALALQRAYEEAGVDPATVGLVEAHGTGTPVGDGIELKALNLVFGARRRDVPGCALGSVKSNVGHLMPASGIAGLIKATLALYHKVLPPTIHCDDPNPDGDWPSSQFYINREVRPWIHGAHTAPRRAGVNAFGFGGINAHAILEEHAEGAESSAGFQHDWDSELFVLRAASRGELIEEAQRLSQRLVACATASLKDLSFTTNTGPKGEFHLGLVAASADDLREKLAFAADRLQDPNCARVRDLRGIYYTDRPLGREGRVALVFPGEGSQYPHMLADLCIHFPVVRRTFDLMDRAFAGHARKRLPSEAIFPLTAGSQGRADAQDNLWEMDAGAEAVFTGNQALFALLHRLGIRAGAMVGHSTGEHSAMLASGMVPIDSDRSFIDYVLGVNAVYERLTSAGEVPEAGLLAVGGGDLDLLRRLVDESEGALHLAMDNCPHQVVLCGRIESVDRAAGLLEKTGAICQKLQFQRAYHTPLFEVFAEPLREFFRTVRIAQPSVPVYSCLTAAPYPAAPDEVRELAASQWARPVRFRETVLRMYEDGVRIFVEAGPRGNLVAFINDILRGRDFIALPANVETKTGLTQIQHLLAQLGAHAVALDLAPLYERRRPVRIDAQAAPPPASRRMHIASGLQPVRLPAGFSVPSARGAGVRPSGTPAGVEGRREVVVPEAAPALPSSGRHPRPSRAARVVERHFATMEEFLRLQEELTGAYLRRRRAGPDGGAPSRNANPATDNPLLGEVTSFVAGQSVTMLRGFDPETDRFVPEHTLGREVSTSDPALRGLPVVPLTISMEILCEAAALLIPGAVVTGMIDVRAYRWITLEDHAMRVRISAVASREAPNHVDAQIHEARPDGEVGPLLAEATVVFGTDYLPSGAADALELGAQAPSAWTPDRLYREGMFHGPCFRAVQSIDSAGPQGIVATLEVLPRAGLFRDKPQPRFVADPVLLDAAGQVVAFWSKEKLDPAADIYPYRVARVTFFEGPPGAGARLACRVRAEAFGEHQIRADMDLVRDDGRLHCRIEGWEDRRFRLPGEFLALRVTSGKSLISVPWDMPMDVAAEPEFVCCRLDSLTEEFLEAHGAIWSKVLAHLVLSRREREIWHAIGQPKRRREWLLGRAAAKDAVRLLLERRLGVRLNAADVEILSDPAGLPVVGGVALSSIARVPVVTISHSGGVAVAAAGFADGERIGIDVEHLRELQDGFDGVAFSPDERRILLTVGEDLRGEWKLRFWCAKEASVKALGRGIAGELQSVVVRSADLRRGNLEIGIEGGLATEFPALCGTTLHASTTCAAGYVTALVLAPRGGEA